MKYVIGVLVAVLIVGGAEGLSAQRGAGPEQGGQRGDRRAQMEERIQARFDAMVREQLGLTDEESQRLQEVLAGFREQRREFMQDERSTRRQLMNLGSGDELTEEQAVDALQSMLRMREEEVRLFREEQEALVGVISARQLVQFVVMREQLNQRIQNIRGGGRGGGPPQGRRPGGPTAGPTPGPIAGPIGDFLLER
jgi:hypothetical protein